MKIEKNDNYHHSSGVQSHLRFEIEERKLQLWFYFEKFEESRSRCQNHIKGGVSQFHVDACTENIITLYLINEWFLRKKIK